MTRVPRALVVLLAAILGVWGCAQGPAGSVSNEKVKALEAKVARLEDDFRAAATARDQFRKKLAETEQASAQLRQEIEALRPVIKERDDLRAQLKARTAERDTVNAQFEVFRKSLKDLLGQTEAAMARPAGPAPVITVSQPKGPAL